MPHPGHRALRKGRASLANHVYHLTVVTAGRVPVFAVHRAARAACRRFEDAALLRDARMLAWVLMPDHAHWLLQLGESKTLQKVVESLKSFSALDANAVLGRRGPLWARAYHDRALRHDEDLPTVVRYIIANPLRAGLAESIGDYPTGTPPTRRSAPQGRDKTQGRSTMPAIPFAATIGARTLRSGAAARCRLKPRPNASSKPSRRWAVPPAMAA